MMIDEIEAQHAIDPSRVFAAGHSNGAMMGIRLGCALADKVVAVGVQSGTIEVDRCDPGQPVSLLEIHGTADANVPIEGGRGNGIAQVDFRPTKEAIDAFVRADGCSGDPAPVADPNPDLSIVRWSHCAAGAEVVWNLVSGATHAWMGQAGDPGIAERSGTPYEKLDSSLMIWTFLANHPRRSSPEPPR